MLAMNSFENVSLSEMALLQMLTAHNRQPNLLIVNKGVTFESVLQRLTAVCNRPLVVCRLPGQLDLQSFVRGTLVLGNVDRLTVGQQITLFDWLSRKGNRVQVVSVTSTKMTELVAEGRFLEGLFYRLNTVVIQTLKGRVPVISW
jgi:hypothetical protein